MAPGPRARKWSGGLLGDAHELVVAPALEADVPVGLGEEGVIHPDTHVDAGLEACAALPHENASRGDELPAEALHAQHLRVGIAALARTADTFLVAHPLDLDLGDAHRCE